MAARILIAEDHADSMALMCYLLQAHDYRTQSAPDGERALAMARDDPPDLIICDLQMPGLDGYQVARLLKADEVLRRIPLVAVTAFSMLGDRERILAAGFDGYFSKPIDVENFVPQLERYLRGTGGQGGRG